LESCCGIIGDAGISFPHKIIAERTDIMTFLELAQNRYSVRKFSSKPVEKEKIDLILRAAQLAPTAVNYQPQHILVIESEEALEKFRRCTKYHFDAPMAFLICYDKEISWKRGFDGLDNGNIDASIVTTHMMLEAADLGLGTTWVGYFDPKLVIETFEIPERLVPVALLPVGYPAEDARPSHKHTQREPLENIVSYNDFSAWQPRK
jgi:nitroreductase